MGELESLDAEVAFALLQGKEAGRFGDGSKLERRPQNLSNELLAQRDKTRGALIYREDRRSGFARRQAMRQQGEERTADRWKNLGGKRSKVVMRLRNQNSIAIIRRKGKILREGLPTLRYDQFCIGNMSPKGLVQENGSDVLYHVGGLLNEPALVQRTLPYVMTLTSSDDENRPKTPPEASDGAAQEGEKRTADATSARGEPELEKAAAAGHKAASDDTRTHKRQK